MKNKKFQSNNTDPFSRNAQGIAKFSTDKTTG